jgi:hypothetical protein
VLPAQQGWVAMPHPLLFAHIPLVHVRPVSHALPVQQGWFSRPHDAVPVQVPATQVSPVLQAVPPQHGRRSAPHWAPPKSRCASCGVNKTSHWPTLPSFPGGSDVPPLHAPAPVASAAQRTSSPRAPTMLLIDHPRIGASSVADRTACSG